MEKAPGSRGHRTRLGGCFGGPVPGLALAWSNRINSGTASLSVVPSPPEARRDQGFIASCLTNIRHSARHVRQSRDQGLSSSLLSFALRDSRASLLEMAIYQVLFKIDYR